MVSNICGHTPLCSPPPSPHPSTIHIVPAATGARAFIVYLFKKFFSIFSRLYTFSAFLFEGMIKVVAIINSEDIKRQIFCHVVYESEDGARIIESSKGKRSINHDYIHRLYFTFYCLR